MQRTEIKLVRPVRFHARPAKEVAEVAQKYESEISLTTGERTVNAKNAISLMMLGAQSRIVITADGADEITALEAIQSVLTTVSGW